MILRSRWPVGHLSAASLIARFDGGMLSSNSGVLALAEQGQGQTGGTRLQGSCAHVGADADKAIVEQIAITPADINDDEAGPDALPDNPGQGGQFEIPSLTESESRG
ncbi:hypothetical protein [Mesorhizobium sp. WSM2561]|uniref:hypothetical protein n=1 Tax=Mesorhizobium sp. WSM2561 TaxID=1040985 RepID=UPI0004838CF1|nr:hypothetical protein [Mesorhizobium sp. WSM2561]